MNIDAIDHGASFDFGKTAAEYAKYRDIYPPEVYEKLYALGVGHSGENWLDLGTGTGVLPKNMIKHGAKITAADISAEQIAFAKNEAEKNGWKINYLVSPVEQLGLPDNSFDSITAAQCFWYFDREKIIGEIRRMLKPGGVFVKVYMAYMLDNEIALRSRRLVQSMNPGWTPEASGSDDMFNHPFDNPVMDVFICKLPFTRETWHGRMCACRGTTASMDSETLAEWSRRHTEMLSEYPESFTINHKVYIAAYKM